MGGGVMAAITAQAHDELAVTKVSRTTAVFYYKLV